MEAKISKRYSSLKSLLNLFQLFLKLLLSCAPQSTVLYSKVFGALFPSQGRCPTIGKPTGPGGRRLADPYITLAR